MFCLVGVISCCVVIVVCVLFSSCLMECGVVGGVVGWMIDFVVIGLEVRLLVCVCCY